MQAPFVKWQSGEHTADIFEQMCKCHDLTHQYSDDRQIWDRGSEELAQIQRAAAELGYNVTVPLWNKHVKIKLSPPHQEQFLWKEKKQLDKLA